MLIHDFLIKANKLYPDYEAVVCGNVRLNYQEVFKRVLTLASYLLTLCLFFQVLLSYLSNLK